MDDLQPGPAEHRSGGGGAGPSLNANSTSEARLRLALDAGRMAVWSVDADGNVDVSTEFLRLLKLPEHHQPTLEELLARYYPGELERVRKIVEQATAAGERFVEWEYKHLWPDDEVRWLLVRAELLRDQDGQPGGSVGVIMDITERKRIEEALKEREGQHSAFIDQNTAGFAQVDATGVFTLVNDRFCEIAGRSREELMTLRMQDITHPDDLDRNIPLFEKAVRDGTPYTHEKRYIRPDGTIVWVNNSVSVIRRTDGELYGVLAVSLDVTDRRMAEEAVRENEARLRAITDNLPGGMVFQISTGTDGSERRFIYVSQSFERLTGYPVERVKEDPRFPYKLTLPEDLTRLAEAEKTAVRTMTPFDQEVRFRRADGEIRWGRIISAPRRQADGSLVWDGVKIDVTDRRNLEAEMQQLNQSLEARVRDRTAELERVHEQLRQSQKLEAMGQLTGGVAHDFNNLLSPILGSLDLLARKGTGNEREQRLINAALESAERARTLVQRLLAFARRQPLQPGPVDVGSIVEGMTDLVASTSGPRVKVITSIAEALPPALAERNQLEMALLNLCVNARDAMPDGGTLSIAADVVTIGTGSSSVAKTGRYVKLSVSDTGVGMTEETAAKAIEPFFSTKGIGRGTGLGLSMVHGLAHQLGGALSIRSRPGLGTTIDLYLPLSDTAVQTDPSADDVRNLLPQGRGSVLLVDDEPPVRSSTAEMLKDLGLEVTEAGDASEALRLLEHWQPDLIVTDHLMPGMTGTELAERIRDLYPQVRTLVISGYADIDGISPDLARLMKPFRQDELAGALAKICESS